MKSETIAINTSVLQNCENNADYMNKHFADFHDVIDFSFLSTDSRARVDDIKITNIEFQKDNLVSVFYHIKWSLYCGCEDINFTDTKEGKIIAKIAGDTVVFNKIPIVEMRSTLDEF